MKKLVIFILFCFVCPTIYLSAQSEDIAHPDYVHQLHLDKFNWMINKDTASLSQLLDEDVSYIHSNGWNESKKELLDNIATGKLTYLKVTVKESEIRHYGDCYIITGKGLFQVSLDHNPIEINLLYTEIYMHDRKKHQLKLLGRHACRI